jgi:lipid II:glycine glycyltransferase (peptidoglycan interpeptide bridge formation enzyme)
MKLTRTEIDVLEKLYNHNFIGGKHTSEDNVPKSFPKHLRGNIKKALKNLIRNGYVTPKMTSYGLEVSLNPRKMEEIKKILNSQ